MMVVWISSKMFHIFGCHRPRLTHAVCVLRTLALEHILAYLLQRLLRSALHVLLPPWPLPVEAAVEQVLQQARLMPRDLQRLAYCAHWLILSVHVLWWLCLPPMPPDEPP